MLINYDNEAKVSNLSIKKFLLLLFKFYIFIKDY